MNRRKKVVVYGMGRIIAIGLLVVFCSAVWSCSKDHGGADGKAGASLQTGSVAPDFTLQDVSGNDVRLSQYRGKVVLLEFWATWCPPCRATVPELVAIQEKYKKSDFAVLGISLDDEGQNLQGELADFSNKFHINYPVLIGSDAVERDYNIWSIPRSFLIDKDGKIRYSYSGYVDQFEKKVSAEVDRLL